MHDFHTRRDDTGMPSIAKFLMDILILTFLMMVLVVLWAIFIPNVPDVQFSNSTRQCVKVIYYEADKKTEVPCPAKLPKRYNLVWVE